MRSWLPAVGGTLVMALFAVCVSMADSRPSDRCARARTVTVARGQLVRLYQRRERVLVCDRRSGRSRAIDERCWAANAGCEACFPDSCTLQTPRVTRDLVAYGTSDEGRYGGQYSVEVFRAGHRLPLRSFTTGALSPKETYAAQQGLNMGIGPVSDLVLSADGGVAWIASLYQTFGRTGYEVHVAVNGRSEQLLASAADIDPGSLARHTNIVTWRQGSQVRCAPLTLDAAC